MYDVNKFFFSETDKQSLRLKCINIEFSQQCDTSDTQFIQLNESYCSCFLGGFILFIFQIRQAEYLISTDTIWENRGVYRLNCSSRLGHVCACAVWWGVLLEFVYRLCRYVMSCVIQHMVRA